MRALLFLEPVLDRLFDVLLLPFSRLPGIAGLVWISALAGALLAVIFRFASDQRRIGRERRIMGGISAGLLLHISDPGAVASLAARLLAANLRYLAAMAPALLAASVPFAVFLGQVEGRFCRESPSAGDTVLVVFEGDTPFAADSISVSGPASAVPPFFLGGDGRTAACRLAFAGEGQAVAAFQGEEMIIGGGGPTSPDFAALESSPSLSALLRPDVGISRSGVSGEAVLRPERYPAFRTGMSGVVIFLAVSTLAAIATGVALRVSV